MNKVPVIPVAAGVLLLDQATKFLVLRTLPLHASIPVAPFFTLTHVRNTGAAFGVFPGGNLFFVVMALLILSVLAFLHKRLVTQSASAAFGLAFVWGGAVGNLLDRLLLHSVTDFLDFFWKNHHWPAFNVADSAICTGIFLMMLDSLSAPKRKTASPPSAAPLPQETKGSK